MAKFTNKAIVKSPNVRVDIKKLIKVPVTKDKARYYKENYTTEKRQLFFE